MIEGQRIVAPFSEDETDALNAWQAGPSHPYTCRKCGGTLRAMYSQGWICPDGFRGYACDFTQDWASLATVHVTPLGQVMPLRWRDAWDVSLP